MTERNPKKYVSRAMTSVISATSRSSVKVRDSYYTVEYHEERLMPVGITLTELKKERELLWDVVNAECDNQVEDILQMLKK